MSDLSDWLKTPVLGNATILDVLLFLVVLVLAVTLARLANMLIRRYLDEPMGKRLSKGVARAVQYVIVGLALVSGSTALLHLDLTAVILSLGLVGIAVAFASQQIIQNAISGVMISVLRPIQLEDWVEVGLAPTTGICRVKDITLFTTVLREANGRIAIVPNSQIINGKVINYTKSGFTAITLRLNIGQGEDLGRIRRIVLEEADRDPYILPEVSGEEKASLARFFERSSILSRLEQEQKLTGLDPVVNVTDIQGTRIKLEIKVWIREVNRQAEIASGFLEAVKERFRQEGVELRDP